MSLIGLVALALGLGDIPQASRTLPPTNIEARADELYLLGPKLETDREALALVEGALAENPTDYELAWRLSRACVQLSAGVPKEEKRPLLERAVAAGGQAVALAGERAEGHYWLGASSGELAAASGIFKALRLVGRLRSEMEAVLRLDADYEGGDAFRALAELDMQLPSLFGGSRSRAIARAEEGARLHPGNLELRLTLAKAYLSDGKREAARRELETLVSWPVDLVRPWVSRGTREEAARLLATVPARGL